MRTELCPSRSASSGCSPWINTATWECRRMCAKTMKEPSCPAFWVKSSPSADRPWQHPGLVCDLVSTESQPSANQHCHRTQPGLPIRPPRIPTGGYRSFALAATTQSDCAQMRHVDTQPGRLTGRSLPIRAATRSVLVNHSISTSMKHANQPSRRMAPRSPLWDEREQTRTLRAADGSEARDQHPTWSHDGQWTAFVSDRNNLISVVEVPPSHFPRPSFSS